MHGTDLFGSVEFQMSLLLFVALSGYVLVSFISQPVVAGEILVGVIIGPGVLAWITCTDFVSSLGKLCGMSGRNSFIVGRDEVTLPLS